MTLRHVFLELYEVALARATPAQRGESFRRLKNGATITVRAQGRKRQVLLGRQSAPVGEGEEATFRRDGQIPADAERREYQAGPWHYVALTWEAPPELWDGTMPTVELPPSL
jgi:hypothetical protein